MKKCILFFVLFSVSGILSAQKKIPLNSLIKTEYSFSERAGEVGTSQAFLDYIADDGIIFRPLPVNGKQYLAASQPSSGLLSWYPTRAKVSRDGDLGFTTGPWEWKQDKNDSSAAAFGNFCTVWQRQSNGEWKFVIDLGNSNNKPLYEITPLKFANEKTNENHQLIKGLKRVKSNELIALDKKFTEMTLKIGTALSYDKFINEESELLRSGSFPVVGKFRIQQYLNTEKKHYIFKPMNSKVSASKDLGFTYGELNVSNDGNNSSDNFYYLRVWGKVENRWIILVEVADKKKN